MMTIQKTTRIIRTYPQLIEFKTFEERFHYLNLTGRVGADVWGAERYLNQGFYKSPEWRRARRDVIARDLGCDLSLEGRDIFENIYVHHMTPITIDDITNGSPYLLDPRYLVSTCLHTHNCLHYGQYTNRDVIERKRNDHILW